MIKTMCEHDCNNNEVLKWKELHGLFTPGGDPAYICPVCLSEESVHVNGIETHCHLDCCPNCGQKLRYY